MMISNAGHCKMRHFPRIFRWFAMGPGWGFLVGMTLLFLLGTAMFSFAGDSGVAWSHLSSEEKKALNRYSNNWDRLSPGEQKRLQKGAREWTHMNPEQRKRIRSKYDRFRQLPPAEQERLRRTHRWYKNLPQDQKTDLKKRWKNRSPEKHRTRRRE
ncbi:MAG: DUF3106 domain-containing protein [Deltaproteobacteria bacterium]|nr:DUF3106 domain-containing protein [Deltaproteobacteria bacterium]